MKFCILFLRLSIGALLLSLAIYIRLYCMGDDGFEPIETESVIIACHALLGILLSYLLIKNAKRIPAIWFVLAFVAYLLLFTFPAVLTSFFMVALATAG